MNESHEMSTTNTIQCPSCNTEIEVAEVLGQKIREQEAERHRKALAAVKEESKKAAEQLRQERDEFEKEREAAKEQMDEAIRAKVKEREAELEKKLKARITEEQDDYVKGLREELQEKSDSLKEMNKLKADKERLEREKDEMESRIKAESERELNTRLADEKAKLSKEVEERVELKLKDKDQVIEQMKSQLEEAKRKAEQGSMQTQGESQEIAIEEFLAMTFPLDTIDEIKTGARGGDCRQTVNSRDRQHCGVIYYESKRSKNWNPAWISKFRDDMRAKNAQIGVLVTEVLPPDMERFGKVSDIWVCTFQEFKGLCVALREMVLQTSMALASQENKGDKMEMLYDFLTSNEFKLQVEGIVEGFTSMQSELDAERRYMETKWKKREKELQKVLKNTTHMYGAIRGIAGASVLPVEGLEEGDVSLIE